MKPADHPSPGERRRSRDVLGLLPVLLLAALTVGLSATRLGSLSAERGRERELLYLPNGKHLKLLSLGQAPLLADWLYLWAIQYYADYERGDRHRYVEHVFGDVIAELDPHYVDPYWLGALILTVEAQDLDAGLRLLDRGAQANPEQWVLPYLAGWECYRAGRFERAGAYFARAAATPGAPAHVRRMRAGAAARAGDLRGALALWTEVLEDPASDSAARAIAERQLRALRVRLDVETLSAAVERFRRRYARPPAALSEIVRAGLLRELPLDPEGEPYHYDPRTGRVASAAGRLLGGRR